MLGGFGSYFIWKFFFFSCGVLVHVQVQQLKAYSTRERNAARNYAINYPSSNNIIDKIILATRPPVSVKLVPEGATILVPRKSESLS